jgi:hypothetical protein
MPAASAGNILFTKAVAFKETTAGTIPTLTSGGRKLLASPTGIVSLNQEYELGAERSVALRNPIIATVSTLVSSNPELSISVPAVSVGELPIWLSGIRAVSPSGAGPYIWDYKPSLTASNSPQSYSIVLTDGQQQFVANYCLPTTVGITADRNGLTSLSATLFAQAVAKNSATLADPVPTSPFLAGALWTPSVYASGSAFNADITTNTQPTGGSAYSYFLDFDLSLETGNTRQSYLAGTTSFSTNAESGPLGGTFSFTVSSTASAVTQWFDALGTAKYVCLKTTDGTYTVSIQVAFIVTDVAVIAGSEDGLTTYTVSGTLAYDPTSAATWRIIVTSDLAALP